MNRITDNILPFLFTEHRSDNKPYLLSLSEQLLSQGTSFSKYKYTWIDDKGRPINTGGEYRWNEDSKRQTSFIALPILCGYLGILASNRSSLAMPLTYVVCSFTGKCISDFLLRYKGKFKKNLRPVLSLTNFLAATPLCCAVFSIGAALCKYKLNATILRTNVFLVACYALNLVAGAFLKYTVYKTYPIVNNVFNSYFTYLKTPISRPILLNSNIVREQNSFPLLPDLLYYIIQFLSLNDIERLSCCSRDLSLFIPPSCKIQKNFSNDFITLIGSLDKKFFLSDESKEDKPLDLGLKRILQILQLPPIPSERFSRLEENLTYQHIDVSGRFSKYDRNRSVIHDLMKHVRIGWAKTSQGDIFLCFKNECGFFLVMKHSDSFDPWARPICKELSTNNQTYEIYFDPTKYMYDFRNTRLPFPAEEQPDIEKLTIFLFGK